MTSYQVFPVISRGIDFLGYKFYHTHILLRKSIKERMKKKLMKSKNRETIASYKGWTKWANSRNLENKYLIQ